MQRTMLKSTIHRATVTDCDLHDVGSITIDPDLLDAADILPHEQVHGQQSDHRCRRGGGDAPRIGRVNHRRQE